MSGFIKDVLQLAHTELDRFQRKATPWDVGARKAQSAKSAPFILWVYKGGTTEPAQGDADGFWTSHRTSLAVEVWHADTDHSGDGSLALFLNLQLACNRIFADRIVWGQHTSLENTEPGLDFRGSVTKATVQLVVDVHDQPQQVPGYPIPLDDYTERICEKTTDTTAEPEGT